MKKLVAVLIMASGLLMFGCGPRGASPEILMRMSEAKKSAEAAEAKAKELEGERLKCEKEKADLEEKAKALQQELETLKKGAEGGGE